MKNLKRIFLAFFSIALFVQLFFVVHAATPTKEELELKIDDVNEEILKLEQEIARYEKEIAKTGAEARTLSNHIKELNLTRSKLLKQVDQINSQIKLSNQNIDIITKKILTKEDQIKLARKTISKTFYDLYRSEYVDPIEIILSEGGIKSLSNEYNNRILLNDKLDSFILQLNGIKADLKEDQKKEEAEKEKLNELNKKLGLEKKAIDQSKAEKDRLLKETKNEEATYQAILAENKRRKEAFEQDLRDYETQLQFILNDSLLPAKDHSVLSWPLKNVIITQFFGKTASSGRLYASGSHSGVDFGAPIGTPIYAVADGIVRGVGDTDLQCKGVSFGKWVFIEHFNGLSTTYGHLSATSVKAGQEVKRGELIALSGNTGHTTGPHLHLTVYAGQGSRVENVPSKSCKGINLLMPIAPINAYLDPMVYLPIPGANMIKKGI